MTIQTEIHKEIARQVSEITELHAHNPLEYMVKLHELILEWYARGVTYGMEREQKLHEAVEITCPHCEYKSHVYHLEWTAAACPKCKMEFTQEEFMAKGNE